MKRPIAAALTTGLLSVFPAYSFDDGPDLDVPYVPTPQPLVEMMLDMVDLKDGDVVWDLGCGDGRMVITAAKRKDIRGVGVDLDPRRIEESKANAKEAGVENKVEFRVADLFETDFSDATVLTMYLLETVNRKLRPVILRDLAPGARIVSNTFTMGEWRHDETKSTDDSSFPRTIYHWVVPANITGEWNWESAEEQGSFKIDQKFQRFTGTASINGEEQEIESGRISGKEIVFEIKVPDGETREYTATADGDTLTGTIDGTEWKATRVPGTKKPLDEAPAED
jgi:SAM-dependent methyltransferase